MGKTFRRSPGVFRNPKGAKKAKIEGARSKAIPPDEYDDVAHSTKGIGHLMRRMARKGLSAEEIAKKIQTRAVKANKSVRYSEMLELARFYVKLESYTYTGPSNYRKSLQEQAEKRKQAEGKAKKVLDHMDRRIDQINKRQRWNDLPRMTEWAICRLTELYDGDRAHAERVVLEHRQEKLPR